jgi:phosphoglycerate dehydrogenase-like enzyme
MRVLLVPAASIAGQLDRISGRLRAAGLGVTIAEAALLLEPEVAEFDVIAGPGTLRCDAALMDRCPRLRGLVSVGVGCEGFDREAAAQRSIPIATGATRQSAGDMASAAIMLMLALSHRLPEAIEACRKGGRRDSSRARSLDGATVGIVGYGAIGREVGRRLRAWDVRVLANSRSLREGEADAGVEVVDLDTLLKDSDVVTLHATFAHGAAPLLDRDRIAAMKQGALLVNIARGGLVDEDALADALANGRMGGAALDCFASEPLPTGSPLWDLPNTILTPHQVGHSGAGMELLVETFIENILRLAGDADPRTGAHAA